VFNVVKKKVENVAKVLRLLVKTIHINIQLVKVILRFYLICENTKWTFLGKLGKLTG